VGEVVVSSAELTAAPPLARRRRLPILIALCTLFMLMVLVFAAFGHLVAPRDPNGQDLGVGLTTPNGSFWLGTDDLGRDVFSRIIAGARTAVIGPVLIALGAMLIGNTLGLLAGYRGGVVDATIMRWVDLMYSLPALLVAIVVVGILGGGYWLAVATLIVLTAPYDTRIVRGATLEQRPRPYVEAARLLGLSDKRIMFTHIWPNVLPLVVANTFLNFAFSIVALAGLSFLGLGVGPGTPDWGRMLAESRALLFDNPASALAPAGMIVLTAAAMNLIGDWLYETLSDRGRAR
jgi:peptide/nickel transport system permease protein